LPITDEQISADPEKQRQVELIDKLFFQEENVASMEEGFQVLQMNADERRFFVKMLNEYKDIIRLFPALHKLNSQKVILALLQEKEQIQQTSPTDV